MAKWKLCRQTYGDDIYEFAEGDEVTIGRGTQNTIVLPSLNISRKHCVITVKKDEVIIKDLKSANGIFVGLKKILPNTPFSLSNNDIIGLGWADGAPLAKVNDAEKFVFKLLKIANDSSIINRIKFQNESEFYGVPALSYPINFPLPKILKPSLNLSLKRKFSSSEAQEHKEITKDDSNIKILPQISTENSKTISSKRIKCNFDNEAEKKAANVKMEIGDESYRAIDIKQECSNDEVKVKDDEYNSTPISNQLLKRQIDTKFQEHKESINNNSNLKRLSESSSVNSNKLLGNNFRCNSNYQDDQVLPVVKIEVEDERYEAFDIKQECFDDEIQIIDSDSDSEQWYIRLSQNSNRESFSTHNETRKSEECYQDSSYSQLDDDVVFVDIEVKTKSEPIEDEYKDDLFTVLPRPVNIFNDKSVKSNTEINEKSQNNERLELLDASDDSIKKSGKNKHLFSVHLDTLDNTRNNKMKEIGDKLNITTNTCNKNITQQAEIKHIPLSENESKKSYQFSSGTANGSHNNYSKKIQLTDYICQASKKSSHNSKGKIKKKNDPKQSKSSKIQITNSQKEERKKKLREIAAKGKGETEWLCNSNSPKYEESGTTICKVSAKVTTSNRGAFLTDSKHSVSKPTNKKPHSNKDASKKANPCTIDSKDQNIISSTNVLQNNKISYQMKEGKKHQRSFKIKKHELHSVHNKDRTLSDDLTSTLQGDVADPDIHRRQTDNSTQDSDKLKQKKSDDNNINLVSENQTEKLDFNVNKSKRKEKPRVDGPKLCSGDKTNSDYKIISNDNKSQHKKQLNEEFKSPVKTILKPMKENKEPNVKNNKKVRFSEVQPEILVFEIEQGNQMKKTNSIKFTSLATHHNIPVFSLQKIALQKILRWNPQWLEEQNNCSEPPPILGHNNIPMAILHSFSSHSQYVELIGDLLLMEIWECLTQGYIKTFNENNFLQMRIECLPLVPPQSRGLGLINISVNVSAPTVRAYSVPREGEILMCYFGEDMKISRFFYVHNVRLLSSPPNNVNSFYSISLQTSFTEKMRTLQSGAVVYGKRLAYISKDLRLFDAMEHLSNSPLHEVILNPQCRHFELDEGDRTCILESQWTKPLNESQRKAVMCAVSAARGERPRIHMIQGPPGTGKSRVICATVMEYFYDAAGKKQKNRGKMLICATSNAAVDELVIRLLDIRQSLPQPDRLKVVRVGRAEAMHPRARDISSLVLAERDVARVQSEYATQPSAALSAEISLLEAKKNMWQTKATSTNDDARKAYCEERVAGIARKIATFRSGNGGGTICRPEQVAQAEYRVLEGADVVLTTLASAYSHKMRVLAGRIALCIVDEAGQAIEPETLVPLTLGITRLVLVGDPQQLPGYICSQRAKQHGLGESLFSRLSSCAEAWGEGGPILLDRQYRMHPHIADYPNRAFYDGRLHNELSLVPAPALDTAPYFVLGITSGEYGQDPSGSNEAEAWGAARVALALRSRLRAVAPASAHSLAVITPYTAQRDLVRRHLRTLLQAEVGDGDESEVEVNTVDSFQGQERSVVVVSLARSHGVGFLTDAGRMNVMLTRAKHALVLCLNPKALEKNHQWRSLVEDAQRRNLYGTLPIHMCSHPSIQQVSNQEILQFLSSNPLAMNRRDQPPQSRRRKNNKRRSRNHVRYR